jgi:hypothetical protein
MKKIALFIIYYAAISYAALAQGGYSYPGNYEFKSFMDGQVAYNFSGVDLLLARNTSDQKDRNFTFLKSAINNWSYVRLSKKASLYTQLQRSDELYLKDPGLTNGLLNSIEGGFHWNPDTMVDLSGGRLGLVGYQDFGSWVEWNGESKSYLIGVRMRDYSNIYAVSLDTGYIANRYTSPLNTGSEYVAYAQANQVYLAGNTANLDLLVTDPLALVSELLLPNNFLILLDYTERHIINDHHEIEASLIGIPLFSELSDLLNRKVEFDWKFSGVNLNRLDSLLPGATVQLDSSIGMVTPQLNSSKNLFKPSQEIHFGWTYIPTPAIRCSAKYSYYSNHLFNNSNLALGVFQNHGRNLQLMTRINISSKFGNWNEIGVLYKPAPGITLFGNVTGADVFRFRESFQVKKNFKILHLSFGLFANL